MKENISGAAENIQESAQQTAERVKESARQMSGTISSAAESAKQRAAEQWGHLQRMSNEQAERLQEQVQQRPLSSVFIALGVGVLLGFLLRGSND